MGASGSGKTWLAVRIAANLDLAHLELDSLRHQPGWRELPDADFVEQVSKFVEQDGWVIDGNYFSVVTEQVIWPAADTVIWIDLPKATVLRQVTWRTLKRGFLRQELWNGNREQLKNLFRWDPHKSIIRWSWTSYASVRDRYQSAMSDPRWQELAFTRLRSPDQMRHFVDGLDLSSP